MALHPTPADYKIRLGDILRVRVITAGIDPGLDGDFPIEENGTVFLPRLGRVEAVGLPFEELRKRLRASFELTYPGGAVALTIIFPVSVLGGVQGPRTVQATPGMTVFDAISEAEGFSADADRRSIQLIRSGQSLTINADAIADSKELAEYALQANDRVFVPVKRPLFNQTFYYAMQGLALALGIYVAFK